MSELNKNEEFERTLEIETIEKMLKLWRSGELSEDGMRLLFRMYIPKILSINHAMKSQLEDDKILLKKQEEMLKKTKEIIDTINSPPLLFGVIQECEKKDHKAKISVYGSNEQLLVSVNPEIEEKNLVLGREVLLDPKNRSIIKIGNYPRTGVSSKVKDIISENRLVVKTSMGDSEYVIQYVDGLMPQIGDSIMLDKSGLIAIEKIPNEDKKELFVENIPDIKWEEIGGLEKEKELLKKSIEYPYLYPNKYAQYNLSPKNLILLHGPPGCGKTLLVKALLNEMFSLRKNNMPIPVVIFFDEADSLFPVRGSGVTIDGGGGSTMSNTIVPALLTQLDGLEKLSTLSRNISKNGEENVEPFFYYIGGPEILSKWVGESEQAIRDIYTRAKDKSNIIMTILATNRPDILDPALLREGRTSNKVYIPRPDKKGVESILNVYVSEKIPISESELRNCNTSDWCKNTVSKLTEYLFQASEPLGKIEYRDGKTKDLFFKDLISGAKLWSITQRASEYAIERDIKSNERGLKFEDYIMSVEDSFREEMDILTSGSPQKWSQVLGKEGDYILRITSSRKYIQQQPTVEVYKTRTTSV